MLKKIFVYCALLTNISIYTMLTTRACIIRTIHRPKHTISTRFNSSDINNNIIKHLNRCTPQSAVEKTLTIALAPYLFTQEEKIYYIKNLLCRNDISPEQSKTLTIVQNFLEQQRSHPFYNQDQTLIHTATQENNQILLRVTLENSLKGSVNLPNKDGNSALYLAASNGHFLSVDMLLYYCADPNIQNNQGQTPLHGIATSPLINTTPENNHALIQAMNAIKNSGAHTTLKDHKNKRPIDYIQVSLNTLENNRSRTLHNEHGELLEIYHEMEKILHNPGYSE